MKKDKISDINNKDLDETKEFDIIDFGNVYQEDQDENIFNRIESSLKEDDSEKVNLNDVEKTTTESTDIDDMIFMPLEAGGNSGNNNNNDDSRDDMNHNKDNNENKLNSRERLNLALFTLVSIGVIGLISFVLMWGFFTFKADDLNLAILSSQNSTKIYDKDGELMQDLGKMSEDGAQENITYNEMPESLVDAFVGVEDSRFFKHKGFDLPRFTKSFMKNISTMSFSQGGSTLTMQLIKNTHLSAEKKIERKIQEIDLARQLEREDSISKQDIFANYVNRINYGAGHSRGVENSSIYFFNKPAKELTLTESAILAGVINRPNDYSPINNLKNSYKRRDITLNLMKSHGYLEDKEVELAKRVKVENLLSSKGLDALEIEDTPYLNYINIVVKEVIERTGLDPYVTGMRVYTNMDRHVQDRIEQIERGEHFAYPDELVQSAVAVVENETGKLVAAGGGRDQAVARGYSRVVDTRTQPGSVIKPILSYALAFEHLGWSTEHVVEDRPIQIAGTSHILQNYSRTYQGEVRLKDALGTSLNTPAYATLEEIQKKIGDQAIVDYLNSIGFEVKPKDFNTQFAIGGAGFNISPKQLAGAQAMIMNSGKYTEPHTVDYVITNDQKELRSEFDYPTTQVLSPEAAYLTSVLENNNTQPRYYNYMGHLSNKGYPVFAKTGTTDYGEHGAQYDIPNGAAKEHWMMASSGDYTSAVWLGYDRPIKGANTYFELWKTEMNVTGKINNAVLDALYEANGHPKEIVRPQGVTNINHVLSVFPYAAPIEGMDQKYIVNGLIAKKFANLVSLEETELNIEPVSDFKADVSAVDGGKKIDLKWSEYPDSGAIAGTTYDISLPGVNATGTRLFHPSWIFGPVQYKADIKVDGTVVEKISQDKNSASVTLDIPDDAVIRICGYYGNSKQNGPEKCIEPKNPKGSKDIAIPNFTTRTEVLEFINQHSLNNWDIVDEPATQESESDKVIRVLSDGQDIRGRSLSEDDLKKIKVEVTIFDKFKEEPDDNNESEAEDKPEPND